jgi:hypothetical protein
VILSPPTIWAVVFYGEDSEPFNWHETICNRGNNPELAKLLDVVLLCNSDVWNGAVVRC